MKKVLNLHLVKTFIVLFLILILVAGCAPSKTSSTTSGNKSETSSKTGTDEKLTIEQIANLKGPDREKILIEGAKKEGKLTWYTTIIVDQAVRPMVAAFQKKYPFIKAEYYRADSEAVAQKVLNEYKAEKYIVDIADGTIAGPVFIKANLAQPFYSPYLDHYPEQLKDKQYAITHLYFYTIGYNTDLVKKEEVPKTYEDLLDPKWKGKLAWKTNGDSGGEGFIGNILLNYGEEKGMEYLKKLKQQNMKNLDMSARAVLDRVIAGEYPIGIQIFNHHAVISSKKGAPVAWQPLEPVLASGSTITILKKAPNPYSAMLFMDFILSEEGQIVYQKADYLPADPKVPAKYPGLKPEDGGFKDYFLKPDLELEQSAKWSKIFGELFLK